MEIIMQAEAKLSNIGTDGITVTDFLAMRMKKLISGRL